MEAALVALLLTGAASAPAAAGDDIVRLQLSPYTQHFARSPEYHRIWLIGVEAETADHALYGAALFRNSFAQPSAYLYPWGAVYRNAWGVRGLFFKWTAGLLYGYKKPYESKVPFNFDGFSPAIIPAVGWTFTRGLSAQVNVLGLSALMFQLSQDL